MKNNFQYLVVALAALLFSSCNRYAQDYTDYYDWESPDTTAYDSYYNDYYDTNYSTEDLLSTEYRSSYSITSDLISTKLAVNFDWKKCYMNGTELVSLKPHWYPTDTVVFDAKGMDIKSINIQTPSGSKSLLYTYDSLLLKIWLDRTYTRDETYSLEIVYVSKPNERFTTGSSAITDAKGLYFINPDGTDKSKPRQIWTQGETESNSAWFPTIDKPNMKTTIEIAMTIDSNFVSLSNGLMVSTTKNTDGTHTDTWKMDQPIAPYLVMMAAGDFAVVKDHWREKEVNYYVDPAYAPYAKEIFGHTPEMIEYYSKLLGVDFPWPKFSQIVVHDFVSGAMENASAVVHMEDLEQTHRELIDGNYEDYICHELFHHWFGDYVTCESWSNIPLNESFADYSEYLWLQHKFGRDLADEHLDNDLNSYLDEAYSDEKDLIRFYYESREDMFDNHSYAKGARVLNMLRNYVGDDAFFASLHLYLSQNAFGTGEADKLRLAFEQITGQDLNWFFNQWFFGKGHPNLTIDYDYNESGNIVSVTITQNNNETSSDSYYDSGVSSTDNPEVFLLPIKIDVYTDSAVQHYNVMINQQTQTFSFPAYSKPKLVNVDADKMLCAEKTDNKGYEEYVYQYYHAPLYMDRHEAIQFCAGDQFQHADSKQVLIDALKDKYYGLRIEAINALDDQWDDSNDTKADSLDSLMFITITNMAMTDSSSDVRSNAISFLSSNKKDDYMPVYLNALKDSSYNVISDAIDAIYELNAKEGYRQAQQFESENNRTVLSSIMSIYGTDAGADKNEYFLGKLNSISGEARYTIYTHYGIFLARMDTVLQNKSLPILLDGAVTENNWWMRYSAMEAAQNILDSWASKKDELLDSMQNLGSNSTEYETKTAQLNKLSAMIDNLQAKMDAIKAAEKDDSLMSIWGN